jgi:hypothetical protein
MGPFSELRQAERANAILRLLDNNPQLDVVTRAMWQRKLQNLAVTEEEYNARVVELYKDHTDGQRYRF